METIGYSESKAKREIYIFNGYIKKWERSQISNLTISWETIIKRIY